MDTEQINRLREEQLKAIEQTNSRIRQLEKFKEDYEALGDRLKTLPDKVKHEVMVPFGDLAFMPGQLVHTNEILVLLGDNWFVDRSASQAVDIVKRRIHAVDGQIKDLEQQKGLLKPRLDFTSEFIAEGRNDVKEIREEYDEEKEKLWKEQHRKSVQRYHEQMRKEAAEAKQNKQQLGKEATKKPLTDEELWARLDKLELQEQRDDEMEQDNMSDKDVEDGSETETTESDGDEEVDETSKKRVRWKDSGAKVRPKRNVITFSHSSVDPADEKTTEDDIESPGDIYRRFVQQAPPTSILKSPSIDFPATDPVAEKPQHTIIHSTSEAFTGSIVERPISHQVEPQSMSSQVKSKSASQGEGQMNTKEVSLFKARQTMVCEPHGSKNETVQPEQLLPQRDDPPKRVSKFKAQRQHIKR